jgi:pheromone shutdown-related protein TraB
VPGVTERDAVDGFADEHAGPGGSDVGSVRVVGTAHVSAESAAEVERVIEAERPDVVAVELDRDRYRRLRGEEPETDIAPEDLLRGGVVVRLLAYWLLSYVQARLAERFDVDPGADMLAAVETAEGTGAEVALVDRDIQVTVRRLLARMTLRAKLRLVWGLALSAVGFGGDESDLDPEALTDADVVTAMLEEVRSVAPGAAEALIDERDAYIAHRLVALRDSGHRIVAVVGAGHRAGVERYLDDPASLPPLDSLTGEPEGGVPWGSLIGGVLSAIAVGGFVLLALAGVENRLLVRVAAAWILLNGVFALVLARAAGARWTSAGVGGVFAWLTSLNPLLAPGWFTGYLELRRRPVRLSDIGRLNELLSDTDRPIRSVTSDMLDVPLFRLVLIVAATNVGSIVASALFVAVVLPWFGGQVGGLDGVTRLLAEGLHDGARRLGVGGGG